MTPTGVPSGMPSGSVMPSRYAFLVGDWTILIFSLQRMLTWV
jgi:hypothetical protein